MAICPHRVNITLRALNGTLCMLISLVQPFLIFFYLGPEPMPSEVVLMKIGAVFALLVIFCLVVIASNFLVLFRYGRRFAVKTAIANAGEFGRFNIWYIIILSSLLLFS